MEVLRERFTIFQTNNEVFDKNTEGHANVFEHNPSSPTDVFAKQVTCQVEKQVNSFKKSKIITHTIKLSDED